MTAPVAPAPRLEREREPARPRHDQASAATSTDSRVDARMCGLRAGHDARAGERCRDIVPEVMIELI